MNLLWLNVVLLLVLAQTTSTFGANASCRVAGHDADPLSEHCEPANDGTENDSTPDDDDGTESESTLDEDDDTEKDSTPDDLLDTGIKQVALSSLESDYRARLEQTQAYLQWIAAKPALSPLLPSCKNRNEHCTLYAIMGHCDDDFAGFMQEECAPACFSCKDDELTGGKYNTGVIQEMGLDSSVKPLYHRRLNQVQQYFHWMASEPDMSFLVHKCMNRNKYCTFYAAQGSCQSDEFRDFMHSECRPACFECHKLMYKNRCPIDPDARNAWKPGDLNAFFENLTTDKRYQRYAPRVWSRPTYLEGDTEDTAEYKIGPWIVSMDNVLSEREASRIIELGEIEGYERSDDWGEYMPDGTYKTYYHEGRTSYHAWCFDCHDDPLARRVLDRIEDITNIPQENYEHLQVLRYRKGEHYHVHHDYDDFEIDRQQGVRIMTVFLYLNSVEEGGGTHFPFLDLTFTPRRGLAVLWPNVLNEDPDELDERTKHEALPVTKGVKFAANAWVHQRDVQGPLARGCKE